MREVQDSAESVDYEDMASYLMDHDFQSKKPQKKAVATEAISNNKDSVKQAANEIFEDYETPENTKDSVGNLNPRKKAIQDTKKNHQTFRIKKRRDMNFKPTIGTTEELA